MKGENPKLIEFVASLCADYEKYNRIDPGHYENMNVKRGLRNQDGTGVLAGITSVGQVLGYLVSDGERVPQQGKLYYRGIDIDDIIKGCHATGRYGYEEVVYLLMFGVLPTAEQHDAFCKLTAEIRELPAGFTEDVILKAPSHDIMNKLASSVLAMYSYDANPDDTSLANILRQSLALIARVPTIVAHAYAVKQHYYENKSLHIHYSDPKLNTAQNFLRVCRHDKQFTEEEARLLDLCLVLHAEHGGGNNSAFACRVLSSSGTDTFSAVSAAVGSLKGPLHGGANIKVMQMMDDIKSHVNPPYSEGDVADYILKILKRKAGDGSGKIYGMGHAVYTLSDPRAIWLKKEAASLAEKRGLLDEFRLYETVERLTPEIFFKFKGTETKALCANVDMYSGFVYKVLDITPDLYTPIFAVARIAGWCAHRIEEAVTGGRIMRPAYKSVSIVRPYVPIDERTAE